MCLGTLCIRVNAVGTGISHSSSNPRKAVCVEKNMNPSFLPPAPGKK